MSQENKEAIETLYLPVFVYGSLKDHLLPTVVGSAAVELTASAKVFGFSLGFGDLYPCADQTNDFRDTVNGQLCRISLQSYDSSLRLLDEYEGAEQGYYRRQVAFTHQDEANGIMIPAWIYTRGPLLLDSVLSSKNHSK